MKYRTTATHYGDSFDAVRSVDGSHLTVGEMSSRDGDSSKSAYFVLASDDPFDEAQKEHVYELKASGKVAALGKDGAVRVEPTGNGVWRFRLKSNECVLIEILAN